MREILEVMGEGSEYFSSYKMSTDLLSEIYDFYLQFYPLIENYGRKKLQSPRSTTFWKMAVKLVIDLHEEDERRISKLS